MNVDTAKGIAHKWVSEFAASIPEFEGAFITGSICELEHTDQIPKFSDVDIILVWKEPPKSMLKGKMLHEDVILDISHTTFNEIGSHELILADYHRAFPFYKQKIFSDPTGRLQALHEKVSKGFSQPKWIRKRIEDAVQHDIGYLDRYLELHKMSAPLNNQVGIAAFAAGIMTHVILTAAMKNPTVRKRYLSAHNVLSNCGEISYYEKLLEFLGCHDMNKSQVSKHLVSLRETFDEAVQQLSTPYMFASDISPIGKIIAIDGSQDLIDHGFHREAVFYMVATFSRSLHVLLADAPRDIYKAHEAGLTCLLRDLGMQTKLERLNRINQIRLELPRLKAIAETISGV